MDIRNPCTWCWVHNRIEVIGRRTYRVCFECGHAVTRAELRRRWHRALRELNGWRAILTRNYWRRARSIYFCQECLHDW